MDQKAIKANCILLAASVSLYFFAVLNIIKEANSNIKELLNFYPMVGPLLGLFSSSIIIYILSFFVITGVKPSNQKLAFLVFLITAIGFFLLVFPPVYEPIVHLLKTE